MHNIDRNTHHDTDRETLIDRSRAVFVARHITRPFRLRTPRKIEDRRDRNNVKQERKSPANVVPGGRDSRVLRKLLRLETLP
jgi:hypothetical protein